MSLKLNSSGGGSVTLQEPTTTFDRTLSLPDNSGTVVSTGSTAVVSQAMLASGVAGNGPAFSAYQSSSQGVSGAAFNKIVFQTEEFDTNNSYDTTTSRFTPTVAGYYQFSFGVTRGNTNTDMQAILYKNGNQYKSGSTGYSTVGSQAASMLAYANGTTDYFEVYCYFGSTQSTAAGLSATFFQGVMVRAA